MKVQLNSDKQISLSPELSDAVEAAVKRALERFESQLTRVEVHLSDLNSNKPGLKDKRCLLEARPAGQKPVSTDHESSTIEQAVSGAAGKMKRLLETSFGKAAHQTSRASLRAGKRAISSPRTLDKFDRIEATLSELAGQSDEESPEFERHVRTATAALEKARLLVEAQQEKKDEPRSAKAAVSKRAGVSTKGAGSAAGRVSVNGRSPKKKGIYRARRKSWPKR